VKLRPSVVFSQRGNTHERLEVIDWGDIRYLRFGKNGGWQGALNRKQPHVPVFPYQRVFQSLLPVMRPRRFLAFGVGSGTSLRSVSLHNPSCELFGVELENEVIDLAIRYFHAPGRDRANYTVEDGIAYLCHTELSFDLIFVDAYLKDQIYSPCLEPAFVHILEKVLSNEGIAICNLITKLPPTGSVRRFVQEGKKVFSETILIPVGYPLTEQNAILVLSKWKHGSATWRRALRHSSVLNRWQRLMFPLRLVCVE
jgi:spermidine synthase